jgi:CheY-like chemotaxis protein
MSESRSLKILVVDDEEIIRDTLREQLSYLGHHADVVADGLLGIRELKNGNYDLVISDIKMPFLGGMDFLQRAKALYPDLPVIVMTGHGFDETRDKVLAAGAFAFLKKPFLLTEIIALLKRLETVDD